jgi:hypothetical protein
MSLFICTAILAIGQEYANLNSINEAYNRSIFIKNKKEADFFIDFLNKIKKSNKFSDDKLIEHFLSDLNIISVSNDKIRDNIFKLIKNVFGETNKEAKNLDANDYLQTENKIKKLEEHLGVNSFYVSYFKMRLLVYKLVTSKNGKFEMELEMLALDFTKKYGNSSFLNSEAYSGLCIANEKAKEWATLKKNANILLKIQTELGFEGYDIIMPVSFLVKSSVMMENYDEAKRYKDILKPFVLESLDQDSLAPQFRIFSSMATVYSRQNKLTNAIAMQEMAVAALGGLFRNDKSQIKEQALVLRELLAKNKEFTSMRNLEERFKLPPLPPQTGEK